MSMPSSSDDVATSARSAARLEQVLDLEPLLARNRAVMRAHERLARQLVQRAGQALGEPAAVHEEQRRAMRRESARAGAGGSPARSTRATAPATRGPLADLDRGLREPRHVFHRHFHRELERLGAARIDDRDGTPGDRTCRRRRRTRRASDDAGSARDRQGLASPKPRQPRCAACGVDAAEELRDLFDGPHGGRQPDALQRTPPCSVLEPLQRQRQVRAALGRHQRVDLVDDHGVDATRAPRAPATPASGTATRAS